MRIFLPRMPKALTRHLPERVIILLTFLIALGVAYWSVTKRYPLIGDYQNKILEVTRYENQVHQLENQFPTQLLANTQAGYLRALNYIFTNDQHLAYWRDYLRTRAEALGLEMEDRIVTNKPLKTPKDNINIMLYQLEVRPARSSTNTMPPHERVLYFLYELGTNQFKKVDFVQLEALGDGSNFNRAVVGLEIYSYTNAP